jgi:hypothetical protein
LEHIVNKFHKQHEIFLRDFNAKVDREDIFKLTIWNESLCKINNDNGVRAASFATSKNLSQKYNLPTLQHSIQVYLMSDHSGQQGVKMTIQG